MSDSSKPRPARDNVLSILDDLDSFAPPNAQSPASPSSALAPPPSTSANPDPPPQNATAAQSARAEDAQSVLDFLDEITQRSSTPTASIPTRKLATNPARSLSRKPSASSIGRPSTDSARPSRSPVDSEHSPLTPVPAAPSWGWGSVLKQATSTVLSQARSAAGQVQSVVGDPSKSSELVKNLNSNLQHQLSGQSETARKWKEGMLSYVKASGIDQIGKDLQATGMRSLTDIMNMVAPPISQHEIIEVQLSYDMIGYDGIETLVYRTLSKVMEQVDGGDLVLNKGDEERAKEPEAGESPRDLQAVEGMTEGYKLALANLEQMIKRISAAPKAEAAAPADSAVESASAALPITHCPVYVRIQPILSRLPVFAPPAIAGDKPADPSRGVKVDEEQHLFFLILLRDVSNSLDHATLTQSMPASWLQIPFEENEWVEDVMVEVIKRGIETIGQQYVNGRLSGRSVRNASTENAVEPTEPPKDVAT